MVWGVVPDVKLGVGTDDDHDDESLLVSSMYVAFDVLDTCVGVIDDNGIAGDEEGAVTEEDVVLVPDDEGEYVDVLGDDEKVVGSRRCRTLCQLV